MEEITEMKNFKLNKLEKVALIMVFIFAFFGVSVFSNVIHELTHYYDLKDYELEEEEICALNIPLDLDDKRVGYYDFTFKHKEDMEKMEEIRKSSEFKASISDFIVYFVAFIFALTIINLYYKNKYYIDENE